MNIKPLRIRRSGKLPSTGDAIRKDCRNTMIEFQSTRRGVSLRFHDPMPCFPPRSPSGSRSRASTVLSRHYDFLTSFSPRFVSFGWRYLPLVPVALCLRRDPARSRGQAVWVRHPLEAAIQDGDARISQVPGEPPLPIGACSQTPVGVHTSHQSDAAPRPQLSGTQGHRHWEYRSSIAWHLDSLSTLRGAGCPRTTQDSLPVVG